MAATSPVTLGPVGRPASLGVDLLHVRAWWRQLVEDVGSARSVLVSTYMYDHQALTDKLLSRLRAGSEVCVLIDKESFQGKVPHRQKARLTALEEKGAQVWLCTGPGPRGIHHKKGVVVDRRVAYVGGPNLTDKSENNGEQCFRMCGPIVQDIIEDFQSSKLLGKQWLPRG